MLTAEQRAQFDNAVAHSDIASSMEEASGWLAGSSPPTARAKAKAAHKKKPGARVGEASRCGGGSYAPLPETDSSTACSSVRARPALGHRFRRRGGARVRAGRQGPELR
jgi:hypothetical protein